MRRYKTRMLWLVVVALLGGFIAYGLYPEPVIVDLARPTRGVLEITVDEDGETRIREKYIVSAPVDGKLLRLQLEEGDLVVQDETELARIKAEEPSLLDARARAESEARVRAAEAAVDQAEAVMASALEALELAEHDFERAGNLITEAAISRAEFDHADHRHRIARADVRSADFAQLVAQHELEQAEAALIYADAGTSADETKTFEIRSPINGRVLNVFHEDARVVKAGTSLLEIGDPKDLEIKIDVLSTDAVRIRPGNKVYIEHWGGSQPLQGLVRLVEPAAFLKISALGVEEKRVNVIVDIVDPWDSWSSLGDGFRIEARIVVEATEPETLKVPSGVLFRRGDSWYAFRVVNQVAEQRAVKPGRTNGLETEIISGADETDEFILHPTELIQSGTKVRNES